jgi:hypothetical protein
MGKIESKQIAPDGCMQVIATNREPVFHYRRRAAWA